MSPSRKRRVLVVLLATPVALLLALRASVLLFPEPDFARRARPLARGEARVPLPFLSIPRSDVDGGNGLVCAFVDARDRTEERVTLVFRREAHPWPIADRAYDLWRGIHFGRVMDVETFAWRLDDAGHPIALDLSDVAAGEQAWATPFVRHEDAVVPWRDVDQREGRPVIRVATWNHMFSTRRAPEGVEHAIVGDYPVYSGGRADCERFFR